MSHKVHTRHNELPPINLSEKHQTLISAVYFEVVIRVLHLTNNVLKYKSSVLNALHGNHR